MIWDHYKGSEIQITLLIEYLKTRTLFEIRITPQVRSIMSSLNNSCWSNISKQEHLFEIRITPQARLIMSSLNDSTCNLKYIELHRMIWTKRHQSYNILKWRYEEKVVKIIKRFFNLCYIEEEWSLIVVNFGWVTI